MAIKPTNLHVQNEVHALLFCQDHRACEPRKHFSVLFTPFFEDFLSAQPFLLQQVNNQLVHNFLSLYSCVTPNPLTPFLSQQNTRLFFFFLRLWIYLWLAETSQEPISQTTWLKVTPHCNHCQPGRVCVWKMDAFAIENSLLFSRRGCRLLPGFHSDAPWGIYSDVTLPCLSFV